MNFFKHASVFGIAVELAAVALAQKPVSQFQSSELDKHTITVLKSTVGRHKCIPEAYQKPILTALLYFPELKDVSMRFKVKHACTAPLTTVPTIRSLFRSGKKRRFIITIRDLQSKNLEPILFKNLPYNAQVGVMGYELSHVLDFSYKSFGQLLESGIGHLSYRYVDRFEYRTDSICIVHGLGYQLLDWSRYVRTSLHRNNWIGAGNADEHTTARERYMNPCTIERRIRAEAVCLN